MRATTYAATHGNARIGERDDIVDGLTHEINDSMPVYASFASDHTSHTTLWGGVDPLVPACKAAMLRGPPRGSWASAACSPFAPDHVRVLQSL